MTHPQTDNILHIPALPALASHAELRQWAQITRDLLIKFAATKTVAEACNCDEADFSFTASDIVYDNTTSGLTADDVQAAIDEIETAADTTEALVSSMSSPVTLMGRHATALAANSYQLIILGIHVGDCRTIIPSGKKLVVTYASLRFQTGATAGTYTVSAGLRVFSNPTTTDSSNSDLISVSSESTSTWIHKAATGSIASPLATINGDTSTDNYGVVPYVNNKSSSPGALTNDDIVVVVSGYMMDQ